MAQKIYKIKPTSEELKKLSPFEKVVASQQFDQGFLDEIFKRTDYMKKHELEVNHTLANKIITLLFYEPSTRTFNSFNAAALRLGAKTQPILNPEQFSSAIKGETLEDSLRMYQNNCDFLVMRHKEDYASFVASQVMAKPFINAGSGQWQHPTQALLDLYTINEQLGHLDNHTITVAGDLLRGRTVESLVYLLAKYNDNKFNFVAPDNSMIKPEILEYLDRHNVPYAQTDNLNSVLPESNILYMTRIQKERFDGNNAEYLKAKGKTIITPKNIELMPTDAIIMHPLPRIDEIPVSVDNNPRAKYFEQAQNGLYVRMALLDMMNEHVYGKSIQGN